MAGQPRIVCYWLLPAGKARRELAGIIRQLAARFDAPTFEPHVSVHVTNADQENPADVLQRALTKHRLFRLSVHGIDYSDEFTKTLFIKFAPDPELSRLGEELRRASAASSDYQLNPHLSLIYKTMTRDIQRELAASVTLPFAEIEFDVVKAVVSPAEIKTGADVESWRVVAEAKLGE